MQQQQICVLEPNKYQYIYILDVYIYIYIYCGMLQTDCRARRQRSVGSQGLCTPVVRNLRAATAYRREYTCAQVNCAGDSTETPPRMSQDRIYTLHVADIDYLVTSGRSVALYQIKLRCSHHSRARYSTRSSHCVSFRLLPVLCIYVTWYRLRTCLRIFHALQFILKTSETADSNCIERDLHGIKASHQSMTSDNRY